MAPPKRLSPMGSRIHGGMVAAGIRSARELASKLNTPPQTIHRWLHDDLQHVDADLLFRLSDLIHLSARWILYGAGLPSKRIDATPTESHLMHAYRQLPADGRRVVMHCVKDLLKTM